MTVLCNDRFEDNALMKRNDNGLVGTPHCLFLTPGVPWKKSSTQWPDEDSYIFNSRVTDSALCSVGPGGRSDWIVRSSGQEREYAIIIP